MYPVLMETPLSLSILPIELEAYIDQLQADQERLIEQGHQKEERVARVVHDLRGSLANLNLRLYLLEHDAPDNHPLHKESLRESVADLTRLVEELLPQMRLDNATDAHVPPVD